MNYGFLLASKVVKRSITFEEGVISSFSRNELSAFVRSFNAIVGRNVVNRYQCEGMINSRRFLTLEELLEDKEIEQIEQLDDVQVQQAAQEVAGEDSASPAATAPEGETALQEDQEATSGIEEDEPPGEEKPLDLPTDARSLDLLLRPLKDEIEVLQTNREDIQHFIRRLEWFERTQQPESSIPPGVISFGTTLVIAILCLIFLFKDHMMLAVAATALVLVLGGVMFVLEIRSAHARQREEEKKRQAKRKELEELKTRLTEIENQIATKERYIEEIARRIQSPPLPDA